MKKQTYFICLGIIIAAIALGLYLGLVSGNPVIPAAITIAGIVIAGICHHHVTEVMDDDLVSTISGKAALAALEITIVIAAVLFAGAMTFVFNGGFGGGFHTYDNGSVRISFTQFDTITHGQFVYRDTYLIADPANMDADDFWGLDRIFSKGHQVKDFPLAFGAAMGVVVVLLVSLYGAFSIYYSRKY
ncbi:MAG TPA: DUF2178 domain-containing protein [Methanoregulaceae archaeon]|nr:DUF2178 domain-containing protein [Methanoregulaceae archaeon]HPD76758.1 DUF2178 domain-containing protein [Methanoregulaceae archaeon]HRY75768.1 DUF2178 domain-containing protein [Methanoregulaceae archaeon]